MRRRQVKIRIFGEFIEIWIQNLNNVCTLIVHHFLLQRVPQHRHRRAAIITSLLGPVHIHQLFLTTCSVSCWTQSILNNTKHPWVKNLMHLDCCSIHIIKWAVIAETTADRRRRRDDKKMQQISWPRAFEAAVAWIPTSQCFRAQSRISELHHPALSKRALLRFCTSNPILFIYLFIFHQVIHTQLLYSGMIFCRIWWNSEMRPSPNHPITHTKHMRNSSEANLNQVQGLPKPGTMDRSVLSTLQSAAT